MDASGRLSHTTLDFDREARLGHPEVVYGEGKSAAHIADALAGLHKRSGFAFATRVDATKAEEVRSLLPLECVYDPVARVLHVGTPPEPRGRIGVASAGTSDESVAAEVEVVARLLGNHTLRIVDVGVAVPTSVGYGTGLGGIAALLAMLNSCAPGVTVVNIDNGFGAAYAASRINHAVAAAR